MTIIWGVRIRGKIVVLVMPLLIAPLIFAGLISSLLARNGITGVASRFLQFKAEQIASYASGQWQLLEENGLTDSPDLQAAAVDAIRQFSANVIRTQGELICAVGANGTLAFAVGDVPEGGASAIDASRLLETSSDGWQRITVAGVSRVAHGIPFEPLDWRILVTERESAYYAATNVIIKDLAFVLVISSVVAVVLLAIFATYLTNPLSQIAKVMTDIIRTNDLSARVDVVYNDETGVVGQRFNMMLSRLEDAYGSVKREALRAVIAQKREQKTRSIFQKYVPADVIDQIFENPEEMLVGKNEVLSVMFSDVRSFTSISEALLPDEMVESLNHYFSIMVDSITNRGGIVDKYMGDAIMAFFGAPVRKPDDAVQSVYAGLDMIDGLEDFNRWQVERNRARFRIGIGINYGNVTVGNIGSEKKMDYTIIGDMVNLASRLEGLSKRYQQSIIISESVMRKIEGELPVRLLDRVVVKGRSRYVAIYTTARNLPDLVSEAWEEHNAAMEVFYNREFERAGDMFAEVLARIPTDIPARTMVERCVDLTAKPPSDGWTGQLLMSEK